jgi:hypothetical protein
MGHRHQLTLAEQQLLLLRVLQTHQEPPQAANGYLAELLLQHLQPHPLAAPGQQQLLLLLEAAALPHP